MRVLTIVHFDQVMVNSARFPYSSSNPADGAESCPEVFYYECVVHKELVIRILADQNLHSLVDTCQEEDSTLVLVSRRGSHTTCPLVCLTPS